MRSLIFSLAPRRGGFLTRINTRVRSRGKLKAKEAI
jgi:hypothetical protein